MTLLGTHRTGDIEEAIWNTAGPEKTFYPWPLTRVLSAYTTDFYDTYAASIYLSGESIWSSQRSSSSAESLLYDLFPGPSYSRRGSLNLG